MKKNKLIQLIELPATIVLSLIILMRMTYDVFTNRLPSEDAFDALNRFMKEDLEMYSWWLVRWTTPTAVALYILLFILIL